MRSLPRPVLAAALLCGLLAVPAAPAAAKAPTTCDPGRHTVRTTTVHARRVLRHLRTLAESPDAWVAATRRDFGAEYFACDKATGRGRRIAFDSGGADVTDVSHDGFVLASRVVAFHTFGAGDENFDAFTSLDVRTGKVIRNTGKVARADAEQVPTRLVVTASGAIAWQIGPTLKATDADGTRPLADDPTTRALAVGDSTVYWTQGDAMPHSALLR